MANTTENANLCGLNRKDFQTTIKGKKTDLYILKNRKGYEVAISNYGGAICAIMVPDKDGKVANVIQGHANIEQLTSGKEPYLSTLIGRWGNRICKGQFTLNGKDYQLEKILDYKMRREEKKKNVRIRLTELEIEEGEKRRDILDYQTEMMNRSLKMNDAMNNKKRFNTGENSISNQMAIQKNMSNFLRKLNMLKSQSITKQPVEKRIKMFKELKRQEAERKKREKEDELLYKDH